MDAKLSAEQAAPAPVQSRARRLTEVELAALETKTDHIVPPQNRRTDGVKVYTAVLAGDTVVRFDVCPSCDEHVEFCECGSPQAPEWLRAEVEEWRLGD